MERFRLQKLILRLNSSECIVRNRRRK